MIADALFVRRFDAVPGHAFARQVEAPCRSVELQRGTTLARRPGAIACTGFNSRSMRSSSMRYGGSSLQASATGAGAARLLARSFQPGAGFCRNEALAMGLSGTWRSLAPRRR